MAEKDKEAKKPLLSAEDVENLHKGTFGELDVDKPALSIYKTFRAADLAAKYAKQHSAVTDSDRIKTALQKILDFGGIDGAHHKQWLLDQVVRILTTNDDDYKRWVKEFQGEWQEDTESWEYEWDAGTPP